MKRALLSLVWFSAWRQFPANPTRAWQTLWVEEIKGDSKKPAQDKLGDLKPGDLENNEVLGLFNWEEVRFKGNLQSIFRASKDCHVEQKLFMFSMALEDRIRMVEWKLEEEAFG